MHTKINLTGDDLIVCRKMTNEQLNEGITKNMQHKYKLPHNREYEYTLLGHLGERAFGKYLQYETQFKQYDLSEYDVLGYEVRTNQYKSGMLITHKNDKPGIYVCVSIHWPTLIAYIKGWSTLDRCNARQSNWQTSWRSPCYAMSENELWPLDTLPATAELLQHQNRWAA